VFASFQTISKLLHVSVYRVLKESQAAAPWSIPACKLESLAKRKLSNDLNHRKKSFGTVLPEHVEYLISEKTLEKYAGKTLEQRALIFHRKNPELKITKSQLWHLYRKNGIKRKVIRKIKRIIPKQ
jgi:hypothetical protein